MRKLFLGLVAVMIMLCQTAMAATPSPQWVRKLPDAKNAEQMIVVAGIQDSTAWISMHEKNSSGKWEQIMTTPGFIGKKGLGKVKEDDEKTPIGTFHFDYAFGIAPDPGCAIPYVQVNEHHYWSGDFNYKYNQFMDVRQAPANFNKDRSERLIDYAPNYTYALSFDYNSECTHGKGYAFFMQCLSSAKPWTGGGIAIPEDKMLFVMQHVRPGCVCIIDSLENLGGNF
ncbi:MAG: hypothetical protein IJQ01_05300 [Selenomonadaceae bacterium]|nr:hypothetical protein [Selenomonadaceae bacterium]MBR0102894.1 hypothetical protein [Selenomonadaceae bacterium]